MNPKSRRSFNNESSPPGHASEKVLELMAFS